ncbi:MAG TPA: hypothetical protein VGE93_24180, partial [Bryobacteraceae bacterium]
RTNLILAYKAETIWDLADGWAVISALRVELMPSYQPSGACGATRAQQKNVKPSLSAYRQPPPPRLPAGVAPRLSLYTVCTAEATEAPAAKREIGRFFNTFDLPADSES